MTNFHGSDLERIEEAYGIKKETLINFSANVNPLGLSNSLLENLPKRIDLIASYPDRNYSSLRTTIGIYTNTNIDNIIVGNGSTELISLCIKALSPKKALIIGPTYSEYEREVKLNGGIVSYYALDEKNNFQVDIDTLKDKLTDNIGMLIICNPNNPTSTAIKKAELNNILKDCKKKNIFVLIDETYVEFVTDIQDVSAVELTKKYENLIVLRGVSKFFSAPGLRLGYAICSNKAHLEKIEYYKNPWTINALAAYAGELMLTDTNYIEKTVEFISSERKRIIDVLSNWNFVSFIEPTANFILVKILNQNMDGSTLFNKLLEQRLMIRDVSNFNFLDKQFFRFCFLKEKENDLLLNTIKNILQER